MQNAKRANKPNFREERNSPDYRNRRNNDNVVDFREASTLNRKRRVDLIPRNVSQEKLIDALLDDNIHIVFAMGSAGTGKTYLATQYAIKCLQEGTVDKIVITRPAVGADGESHGFLPGTLIDKMMPWMMPILDVFKEYYSPLQLEKMIKEEIIEIAPLAFMRGRTFGGTNRRSVIICDEAQNTSVTQMKMLLTRIGEGSKIIVTGDMEQHDKQFNRDNGLQDFTDRLATRNTGKFSVVRFTPKDVERHEVIEDILNIYKD